jgi:hypothetical protein
MNCQLCQRHLLSCERLDSQPPEVAGHLAECHDCRQWQARLLLIESHVPLLPLPLSQRKEQFLRDFAEGKTILPMTPTPKWSRRQILTLATGVAAAIALVACGIIMVQTLSRTDRRPLAKTNHPGPRITDNSLAGRLLELDLRLAETDSLRERVETLAQVADNIHVESRDLARIAKAKDLDSLARLYSLVVQEGIVARARNLPADERRETLDPIADQLARTRREAEALAEQAPETARPLLVIAAAASTGDRQLRDLLKEATP